MVQIKVLPAKDGEHYLTLNETPLSSRYAPNQEAQRILAPFSKEKQDVVVLLGAGHLALVKRCQIELQYSQLLVIEEHNEIIEAISPFLAKKKAPNVFYIAGDHIKPFLKKFFSENNPRNVRIIAGRNQWKINPKFYQEIKSEVINLYDKKSINVATLGRFEKLWLRNITKNTETIISAPGVKQLKNVFLSLPAMIIGAGPSLTSQLKIIKSKQKNIILIAVDTVYQTLLHHHIYPHFVVTVDPQKINSRYIEGINESLLEKSHFIAEPAVCPKSIRDKKKKLFLFNTIFPYFKFLCHHFGEKGNVDMGGSVATTAFDLAIQMGFDKVALVGLDLSYSGDAYHLPGTMYEEHWFSTIGRLKTFEMLTYKLLNYPSMTPAKNKKGKRIYLDAKFTMFIRWFEDKVAGNEKLKQIFVNCTDEGYPIQGIDYQHLTSFVDEQQKPAEILSATFEQLEKKLPPKNETKEKISFFLAELALIIKNLKIYQKKARLAKSLLDDQKNQDNLLKLQTVEQELFKPFMGKEFASIALQKIIHQVTQSKWQTLEEVEKSSRRLYEGIDEVCDLNVEYLSDVVSRMSELRD